jgi:hypothetical protein
MVLMAWFIENMTFAFSFCLRIFISEPFMMTCLLMVVVFCDVVLEEFFGFYLVFQNLIFRSFSVLKMPDFICFLHPFYFKLC